MKRTVVCAWLGATAVFLAAGFSHLALADDETDQLEIKVQATLDATNCGGTPPTISVLGLTIDIGTASLNNSEDCDGCGDVTCADLTVGQVAEVKLASDAPDPTTGLLSATEVDMGGGDCEESTCDAVKIVAPLQAIDLNVPSVTVLGLVVNISQARLQGADDADTEGENQLVDASQLVVGQMVEIALVSNQPPLAATTLEVKNFTNQVDVEVDDQNGQVDDGDVDDVQVDVEETVVVHALGTVAGAAKHVRRTVRLHTATNGSFTLSGLPTGRATITVTRGTSTGHKHVQVRPNRARHVKVRLR